MGTTTERRGVTLAVALNIFIWLIALGFWPATVLIAVAVGSTSMTPGVVEMHAANSAGFLGFIILAPVAFAVTVVTLAAAHIRSLTDSSTGARIGFGVAWAAALIVGALVVFLIAQFAGFFFFASFFEGLF